MAHLTPLVIKDNEPFLKRKRKRKIATKENKQKNGCCNNSPKTITTVQKKKKTKKLLKTPQPFEMAAKTEYLACINWIII
jgi:hypothetical protein